MWWHLFRTVKDLLPESVREAREEDVRRPREHLQRWTSPEADRREAMAEVSAQVRSFDAN